jgi:hypothetical protein
MDFLRNPHGLGVSAESTTLFFVVLSALGLPFVAFVIGRTLGATLS